MRLNTAEEAAEILLNDHDGSEMDSGHSFDETSSSDVEETSESEICSNNDSSFETSYFGCKIMFNQTVVKLNGHPSKQANAPGEMRRAISSHLTSTRT